MKILVLKSSGNKNGSSNMLADQFIWGAEENGNEVTEFDVFRADIRPCAGCGHCRMDGPCAHFDDFENRLKDLIKETDMLVFVMPVYYYGWPAQLKAVVDRFYSFNGELMKMKKKTALLGVAWEDTDEVFAVTDAFYRQLCSYLGFRDQGTVYGRGCGTPDMTRQSSYPAAAYELGKEQPRS